MNKLEQLSEQFTGWSSNPLIAFEQWEQERQALMEFHDLNQALQIHAARVSDGVSRARDVLREVQSAAALFLPARLQEKIANVLEQINSYDNRQREILRLIRLSKPKIKNSVYLAKWKLKGKKQG